MLEIDCLILLLLLRKKYSRCFAPVEKAGSKLFGTDKMSSNSLDSVLVVISVYICKVTSTGLAANTYLLIGYPVRTEKYLARSHIVRTERSKKISTHLT